MRGQTVFDLLRGGDFDAAARELVNISVPTKLESGGPVDSGRPHPVHLLDHVDIMLNERPVGSVGRRLNINKPKSRS